MSDSVSADDAKVHPGVRAAAAWTWRLLLIGLGIYVIGQIFERFQEVFVPVALAILFAALLTPFVNWLERMRVPRLIGAIIAILLTLTVVALGMWFVIDQLIKGIPDIAHDLTTTITDGRTWLEEGPLKLDSDRLREFSDDAVNWLETHEGGIAAGALDTATTVGKIGTGALLTVFLLIFFLYEGGRLWGYLTRLVPVANRALVRDAGTAGFRTLESYVRTTVLVAFIDAVLIGIGLLVLRVPMALPLTAVIFLGAFIPIIGSIAAGTLAVVLALATQGWLVAVVVLAILVLVMQLEGHVLQPFLLGRSVRLHPVAVILAITMGLMLSGIVGGLLAVPLLAFLNTAIGHGRETPVDLSALDSDAEPNANAQIVAGSEVADDAPGSSAEPVTQADEERSADQAPADSTDGVDENPDG